MFPHPWLKKLSLFSIGASLVVAFGCRTVKIIPGPTPIVADGQALTSNGENSEPSFSPDGQKIVYVSAKRDRHSQGQIYELDLKSHRERRITFQRSVAHTPRYSPKGDELLYASAADELEENPPLLQYQKKETGFTGPIEYLEPTELYLHHLRGLERQRLTKHAGYDGQPTFISLNEIVFTRQMDKGLSLMEMSARGKSAHSWHGAGARAAQLSPSPTGKRFVWIEYSEDYLTSQLRIKDGHKTTGLLTETVALIKDPVWTADGEALVFSMNSPDKTHSEIYWVKRDGSCLTALTNDHVQSEQPAVSPSGDAFLFVSNQSGTRQIYLKSFPRAATCAPPTTGDKVGG